jgi:hypothetical protein
MNRFIFCEQRCVIIGSSMLASNCWWNHHHAESRYVSATELSSRPTTVSAPPRSEEGRAHLLVRIFYASWATRRAMWPAPSQAPHASGRAGAGVPPRRPHTGPVHLARQLSIQYTYPPSLSSRCTKSSTPRGPRPPATLVKRDPHTCYDAAHQLCLSSSGPGRGTPEQWW